MERLADDIVISAQPAAVTDEAVPVPEPEAPAVGFNSFPYDGQLIANAADLIAVLRDKIGTKKQAEKLFMSFVVRNNTDRAIMQIGYWCGELDIRECDRLLGLFGINHPFAGREKRTINQLIARGMALGEEKALETYRDEQMIKLLGLDKPSAKPGTPEWDAAHPKQDAETTTVALAERGDIPPVKRMKRKPRGT